MKIVIGHWSFVIGHWSLVIGDKLKGGAFCQLPYMVFGAQKDPIYGIGLWAKKSIFSILNSQFSILNSPLPNT
ncbi:MAG: hypothetical protein F6K41_09375 [Symploca sp. SIO3E6]|nr:hypothetical protein [Caldora sp. SIO3E6]